MPAGFIGFRPTTTSGSGGNAPGVWNLREVFRQRKANLWPEKHIPVTPANEPTNLAATPAVTSVALSWTAPTDFGTEPLNQYQIEYNAGSAINPFTSTTVDTGSTSTSHTITGLTADTQYAFRVRALTGTGQLLLNGAHSAVVTATTQMFTPNTDTKARFYLHSTATSVEITAETTTNYYKVTHNGSSIIAREHPFHTYPTYYYNTTTGGGGTYTIINRPRFTSVNTSAVVVVESCDVSGNASGNLRAVDISKGANKIKGVDISGCTSLHTLNAGATGGSSSPTKQKPAFGPSGSRAMASLITSVRATSMGTALGGSSPQYYNPTWTPAISYVYQGGIDLWNQQLSASALNQLYTDLANSGHTGASSLMVGNNPGTGSDNPSLATGVTVYGS